MNQRNARRLAGAIAVAFATAGAGCDFDLFQFEVESKEVCITDIELEFTTSGEIEASMTHTEDELHLELGEEFDTDVRLVGVGISALEGVDDLSFVTGLRVAIASPNASELPRLTVLDLDDAVVDGPSVFLESDSSENLGDYLDQDELELDFDFAGDMPEGSWSVNVDVCFQTKAQLGL